MKIIKKLVIPAAGYGTRFLPFTKAVPKEMIPVIDRPVIDYVVEEGINADISEIIFIVSRAKNAIADYFDHNPDLENQLEKAGKTQELEVIRTLSQKAKFFYVRQTEQLGNGHAILLAKEIVGNEPFVVLWADDFVEAEPNRVSQMMEVFRQTGGSVLTLFKRPKAEDKLRYGYVKGEQKANSIIKISDIMEKPGQEAPSDFASVGGYIFTPTIFKCLENQEPGKNNEIWLVDAIKKLIAKEPVYGKIIENGDYHDCGNKLEYLKTVVKTALKNPDIGPEFNDFIHKL